MTRPDKKEGVASVKVRDALALGYSCRQLISQQGIAEPEPERPRPEQATTLTQERERGRVWPSTVKMCCWPSGSVLCLAKDLMMRTAYRVAAQSN